MGVYVEVFTTMTALVSKDFLNQQTVQLEFVDILIKLDKTLDQAGYRRYDNIILAANNFSAS